MKKQLMKGNEAIVKSAILAGCRAFYGYPLPGQRDRRGRGGVYAQDRRRVCAG